MSSLPAGATQYVIHDQLSAGGMGAVHLGTMVGPAGMRRVALKRIHSQHQTGEGAPERLISEARLVFRLTHGSICQVLDLAQSDAGTFMVMEFVDGLDLRTLLDRLDRRRTLDLGSVLFVAREVARALDYAHRRTDDEGHSLCLVHGDVKPENVLLSREGEVKLADFGISRALGTPAPGNYLVGGTPGFMAPEVESGGGDHRADIYSLGVTLFVALGGGPRGGRLDLEELARRNQDVTRDLLAVIARATASRPDDRYSSAAQLEQALSNITPPFSPSTLARLVAAHADPTEAVSEVSAADATLVSITSGSEASETRVLRSPRDGVSSERAGAPASKRTRQLTPRRPVVRPAFAGAALIVLLAGGWYLMGGDTTSGPVAVTSRSKPDPVEATVVAPPPPAPPADVVRADAMPTPSVAPARAAAAQRPARASAAQRPAGSRKHARAQPEASPDATDATDATGFLTVNAIPWGVVFVDGKRVADQTPLYRVPFAVGKHRVYVFSPARGVRSAVRTVVIHKGKNTTAGFDGW